MIESNLANFFSAKTNDVSDCFPFLSNSFLFSQMLKTHQADFWVPVRVFNLQSPGTQDGNTKLVWCLDFSPCWTELFSFCWSELLLSASTKRSCRVGIATGSSGLFQKSDAKQKSFEVSKFDLRLHCWDWDVVSTGLRFTMISDYPYSD